MTKHIWIINHYAFPLGYGLHTRQHTIAKMLIKLGYRVTIFASSFNHLKTKDVEVSDKYKIEEFDEVKYVWIKTSKYSNNGLGRIKNIFEFSKNLNSIYKKFDGKPDIVWASSPQPLVSYNALKIKEYYKCKFIFEERDIWPLTLRMLNGVSKYNPLSMIFRYLQLQAYKYSNIIVTPLDNLKEYIESSGYKNKTVKFLPQPFVEFNIKEIDLDLPKDNFIVGYVGSIGHSNSVFNLIKSAKLLKDEIDIYFLIIGDGPQLEELKLYCLENNIINIKFTGNLEKEKTMYSMSRCDILYKGNPDIELYKYGIGSVKIIEYLWYGKPIVHATNITNDLVSLSNTGIVIKSDDEYLLAENIKELKSNQIKYNEYSNNGKKYVLDNFTEEKIIDKLKIIMEEL
jgi:glycosyltransferase involved in cell wall biosynthesis